METRINYTAVGLFVVVLTIGLIGGVLLLSTGVGRAQYQDYVAYVTESVSGLNISAPVKYKGVDVGYVREIGLRPGNPEEVRILMAIEQGTPVKTDTIAILSVQGLTGIAFIDLTGGSVRAPMLEARPGETHPVIETGPSLLARLDAAASQMFTNIERVSDSLGTLIDPDSQDAIRETLANLRSFTARLDQVLSEENAAMLGESVRGMHEVAQVFARNSAALEGLLQDLSAAGERMPAAMDRLDRTAESLERMGDSLAGAGDQLTETMRDAQVEVRHVSQQLTPEAVSVLNELRMVGASLERFVAELERDPAILFYGRRATVRGPGE